MSNSIKIILQALSNDAVIRSIRGIVMIVLKDSVVGIKTYKGKKYVKETYTAENKAIIDKCFDKYGVHTLKVVCYSESISEALNKIEDVEKFNYLACPEATTDADKKAISDFIKYQRNNNNILVHAVLANYKGDHEGVINFTNTLVTDEFGEYNGAEYCVDVACMIATLSIERSLTNYVIKGIKSVEGLPEDNELATQNGELFIYYDYDLEAYIFSDGVNSLTTLGDDEKEILKKIRICEIFDMVRDDLKVSFKKSYRGKIGNSYNNRKLIRDSFNMYFKSLARQGLLNPDEDNSCWLDVDATKEYLESKGIDTQDMSDDEILKKDIDNKLFIRGHIYALDTIDELEFVINY